LQDALPPEPLHATIPAPDATTSEAISRALRA